MKRLAIGMFTVLAFGLLFSFGQVQAVDNSPVVLTEKQIESIRDRCLASKVALDKLHSTDALLRVTLGQQYENISSRLMAPLNSRIALNSYDGIEMAQTTVNFNRALDNFRSQYRSYESSVGSALGIDCRQKPVEYYGAIENARERRSELYEATREVNKLTQDYLDEFDIFAAEIMKEESD